MSPRIILPEINVTNEWTPSVEDIAISCGSTEKDLTIKSPGKISDKNCDARRTIHLRNSGANTITVKFSGFAGWDGVPFQEPIKLIAGEVARYVILSENPKNGDWFISGDPEYKAWPDKK